MHTLFSVLGRRPPQKKMRLISLLLLLSLVLSACGGDQQPHQQADQNKTALDNALTHARTIGVPEKLLRPIEQQETQLSATHAPVTLFSDQPASDYYKKLGARYQTLLVQVRGLSNQATQQFDAQATQDLQSFEGILSQRQAQGFAEAKTFADQLSHYHDQMIKAQYPKDYQQISNNAQNSTQALRLMGVAYDSLSSFRETIKQLQISNVDVTAMNQQEQYDVESFRKATQPQDFAQIVDQINTQIQASRTLSAQAIPYVGAAKLKQLGADIAQMKQYGEDVTSYQKSLDQDQLALSKANGLSDFLKVSNQIDQDLSSTQVPLLRSQANYLLKQFHDQVTSWGNAHQYNDSYNGQSYPLDYEYNQAQGFGGDLDAAVQNATSADDYQSAITLINDTQMHLKAMIADNDDHTPWNHVHATDQTLMQHYGVTSDTVLVVSLIEQAVRFYQNGKLVRSFQVTTGQFERPSPPGLWHVFLHESPTVFKSSDPKNSVFWYPDTKINYAMEYHEGGFFFHDSWWRNGYGPGSNFPHNDPGSDNNGSHGCVNMQEDEIAWLYPQIPNGTPVIMY